MPEPVFVWPTPFRLFLITIALLLAYVIGYTQGKWVSKPTIPDAERRAVNQAMLLDCLTQALVEEFDDAAKDRIAKRTNQLLIEQYDIEDAQHERLRDEFDKG